MIKIKYTILFTLLGVILTLTACGPLPLPENQPPATITPTSIPDEVAVETIDLVFLETFPLEIVARIGGELRDHCHKIDQFSVGRDGALFKLNLTIAEETGECSLDPRPFDFTVSLDIFGLPAGIYAIEALDKTARFELPVDNILIFTETPVVDNETGVIRGEVWHDACSATSTDGCLDAFAENPVANGMRDPDEGGIPGVTVNLGDGPCPSTGFSVTTTNERGLYVFSDLPAGTYCVSIEPLEDLNLLLLVPGEWTVPGPGQGAVTVELAIGEQRTDINYGWDYLFEPPASLEPTATPTPSPMPAEVVDTPTPTITPTPCIDAADFLADVTIPDDTIFQPGDAFVKTWQFQNTGTCTWNGGYGVEFVEGDPLGLPDFVPFQQDIAPGEVFEFSVDMMAPASSGTFRSTWQLRNSSGVGFGTGAAGENLFWAQIIVP